MQTVPMMFNRGEVKTGQLVQGFTQNDIKNAPGLWNASVDVAMNFGGAITQAALASMNLGMDYNHITVDVKTHLLQPGMFPAIPGWHTDGVPRGGSMSPARGTPNIFKQEEGRSPRYHLMVLGCDCPTMFVKNRNIELNVPCQPDGSLYKRVSEQMARTRRHLETYEVIPGIIYEWDWWELHTAQAARSAGWRYLIRVTESDYLEPQKDLNEIFRKQQQVFVTSDQFGW
ncbi:hypothetical protein [Erwinia phage Virsaitis27]|nr:hypothetical protein [Erwinia phage Virsaitis27]